MSHKTDSFQTNLNKIMGGVFFPDGYAGEATFQRLELKFASKLRELSLDNRALKKQLRYTQEAKLNDYLLPWFIICSIYLREII